MANISRIKLDETTYEIKDAQAARASDLALKQDALTAGNGIAIDNSDVIRTTGIPFGTCDSTSTSKVFTATVPGIYKLEDGVCCIIKNGVVTSESGFTLNVNGLGAKPSYSNMATGNDVTPTEPTRDTTIFNINYAMLFIYSSTIVEGGGWICYRGYDANTNTIGYQVRTNSQSLPASQKFYRYRLLFTSADGTHYVPANTSSSTNATSSRTVNQTPIDPFGHITYYGATAAVEANARPGAASLWIIYTLNLGYSFNRTGAALTLSSWAPVYVKCAPQSNGSAIIDADHPYVQALPTTNDGKIYIFLGIAYSATNIELLNNHPVYYHDGTGIKLWMGRSIPSQSDIDAAKPLIVTAEFFSTDPPTPDPNFTCDTSNADIYAAWQAGRNILLNAGEYGILQLKTPVSDINTAFFIGVLYDDPHSHVIAEISTSGNTQMGFVNFYNNQPALTFDNTPTQNSNNPVKSGGVYSALQGKEDKCLVVTFTENNGVYSADKTLTQIVTAASNGVKVFGVLGYGLYNLVFYEDEAIFQSNFENTFSTLVVGGNYVEYHQGEFVKYKQYSNVTDLNADDPATGTIGRIPSTGVFYIYEGGRQGWKKLIVDSDLSSYVPTSRTINGKALTTNITLNASDVGAIPTIISTTYANLVTTRTNSQLIAGAWYRITDYTCTTTQTDTQNAGHQFDILVQATSPNTLSEEAKAIRHEGDTYFANSNLEDWKIWYCLDNDTTRFAWADATNGKGVIYHMIDEWNNDCPYDFKNIQFKRDLTDGELDTKNGTTTWVYTFNLWHTAQELYFDASIIGNTLKNDEGFVIGVYNNKMGVVNSYTMYYGSGYDKTNFVLPNNVFITNGEEGDYNGCYSNTFGNECFSNTLGNGCFYNTFGETCIQNTFGNTCSYNIFGSSCSNNTFGYDCYLNTFGETCSQNTFGNNCSNNTFGNSCCSNTFGKNCSSNTFDSSCYSNMFGNEVNSSKFGNSCSSNTFGNNCSNNTFGNYCYSNTLGNNCSSNTFGNACGNNIFSKAYTQYVIVENGNKKITLTSTQTPTSSNPLRNITIAQGVNNTNTAKTISHNTLNDTFRTTYTTDINGNIYAIAPAKYDEWDNKQSALVSGTNIKTINNQSLLGSGNLTASDIGALPSNTHIPSDIKVGSVAGKLYRNNVAGSGNFTVTGNSGCIPNLTAGTFLISIYAKSTTQSYTFRFNFGSSVTYDLSTTNGEINDVRQITIPSSGTFSGLVLNGSVASGTILYVVMYNYLTPISTVGPAAVTNRYADLDGTPTIPTVNNGTLTIQRNGTTVGTFTANLSSNTTANINVPILTSVTVSGTGAVTQALDSNKFYKFGSLTSLTLTLNAASEGLAIYGGKFTADSSGCTLSIPSTVTAASSVPTILGGSTYEFNIMDNVLLMIEI